LDLVPAQSYVGGAMFWQWNYVGGNVTVYLFGTYSSGTSPVADGFIVYLFLQPTMWSISPGYNYSIQYTSTAAFRGTAYPSINEGDVILPQSSTPYIIVEWESYWQFGYTISGATGQWNVWIVNNPSGNNPSFSPYPSPNLGSPYAGWGGIGTGAFQPRPGDRIEIIITYDPTANVLSGSAYDITTGQSASFTVNLNGYYTPPSSGNYVFGVGAAAGYDYANWALMYVGIWGTLPSIPTITATTTVTTTTTVTIPVTTTSTVTTTATTTSTSTVTSLVTTTVTSPVTTTVISTVTSPTTTTVTSTTTSTVTTASPVTVTTTVFTTPSIIQTMITALVIIIMALAAALVAVMIRRR
ncbi:MAG: PA14 domain-containing protein, partial [Caldivirga sp.]